MIAENITIRPTTLQAVRRLIDLVVMKAEALTRYSFNEIESQQLDGRYMCEKWEEYNQDFARLYLNLGRSQQPAFMRYFGIVDDEQVAYCAQIVHKFCLFCTNYDSAAYTNPFTHSHYGQWLREYVTGNRKLQGVKAKDIFKAYTTLPPFYREFLVKCAFVKEVGGEG